MTPIPEPIKLTETTDTTGVSDWKAEVHSIEFSRSVFPDLFLSHGTISRHLASLGFPKAVLGWHISPFQTVKITFHE